jgi:hypothetical protein
MIVASVVCEMDELVSGGLGRVRGTAIRERGREGEGGEDG